VNSEIDTGLGAKSFIST